MADIRLRINQFFMGIGHAEGMSKEPDSAETPTPVPTETTVVAPITGIIFRQAATVGEDLSAVTPAPFTYREETASAWEVAVEQVDRTPFSGLLKMGVGQLSQWGENRAEQSVRENNREVTPDMLARDPIGETQAFSMQAWAPGRTLLQGSREFDLPLGLSGRMEWNVGVEGAFDLNPQGAFQLTIPLTRGGGRVD